MRKNALENWLGWIIDNNDSLNIDSVGSRFCTAGGPSVPVLSYFASLPTQVLHDRA